MSLPQQHVSLAAHTTLQVGGPAQYWWEVRSVAELHDACVFARKEGFPITVLGGGSNVLVSDAGVSGLVIKIAIPGRTYENQSDGSILATIGAGENWDSLVADTVARGWWGLENLSSIPGLVGAVPVQNVGAYGVEVSDLIESVTVYDISRGVCRELTAEECQFGYRHSYFKTASGSGLVVVAVRFRLSGQPTPILSYADMSNRFSAGSVPSVGEVRAAIVEIRAGKFPDWSAVGTAGSFFKNPIITQEEVDRLKVAYPGLPAYPLPDGRVKVSLGWILDKICNLRGSQAGSVGLYQQQALVLVHYGGGTAAEIDAFAADVARQVREKTGIEIEREVRSLPAS